VNIASSPYCRKWARSGARGPSASYAAQSPGADVAEASPVPVQMWQGRAQSPGADVAGCCFASEARKRMETERLRRL
jgi:hypothetical protein